MDFTEIKVVFTDIDDTLLDFSKCAESAMTETSDIFGIKFPENAMQIFHKINDSLWKRVESGEINVDRLYEIRWNTVFSEMGIEFDGIRFEKRFLETLRRTAEKVDGAEELCKLLSSKYILCAASNAPYVQQCKRLEISGLLPYFNKIYVSEKVGFAKPQKEFFDIALNGIDPENALMIGDSVSADIDGARKIGMKTIWFNKKKKDTHGVLCDKIVYSLYEISDMLS